MYMWKRLFSKSLIEKETLCTHHHGSANYGQGASECEHWILDVNLGNIIISCGHIAQVPDMPVYKGLQARVDEEEKNKNRFERKQQTKWLKLMTRQVYTRFTPLWKTNMQVSIGNK